MKKIKRRERQRRSDQSLYDRMSPLQRKSRAEEIRCGLRFPDNFRKRNNWR